MAVDLSIITNFTVTVRGVTITGRQGTDEDAVDSDPFVVSVDGDAQQTPFTLATATAVTIWDDDSHKPSDFDYCFIVADQDIYAQFIASATNFIVKIRAGVPFTMSYDSILAAANTTAMSGAEPSVTDIDSIVIQNNSGTTVHGVFVVID